MGDGWGHSHRLAVPVIEFCHQDKLSNVTGDEVSSLWRRWLQTVSFLGKIVRVSLSVSRPRRCSVKSPVSWSCWRGVQAGTSMEPTRVGQAGVQLRAGAWALVQGLLLTV